MADRKKDLIFQAALLALLVLFFAKILFSKQIVRAHDISTEYYWSVLALVKQPFLSCFHLAAGKAGWDMFRNSGTSPGGGTNALQFLNFRNIIFHLIPAPTSVAWFMVLHLFFGAAGVYCCCRLIGASRSASFLGGLIFAVAPENASLINAGHVLKIATISFAPWAFYFFEKGFRTRRVVFFLTTGFVLAFQFFNIHWQIAYYTCLGIGVYGVIRSAGIVIENRQAGKREIPRLLGMNLVVMLFFLATVAISLAPLADWSKDTNRGGADVASSAGSNASSGGQGRLDRDDAMAWSLPPEELGAFVIPGFFGLSRQEEGDKPTGSQSYYWGRMHFSQTVSYMGLLPWILVPLPLIFRRDRYAWLALVAVIGGVLFSMGKYTPFYNLLFDYFPGINRFRVPKMFMFIPVLGLGVLAARGVDILLDAELRKTRRFRWYLYGVLALPVTLIVLLVTQLAGEEFWLNAFSGIIDQPTNFEQGPQLVAQRWHNLQVETGIAIFVASYIGATIFAFSRKWISVRNMQLVLLVIYLLDAGRVDSKFLNLEDAPHSVNEEKSQLLQFLSSGSKQYRVLPMDDSDPMMYVSSQIPVVYTFNPVQKVRWQHFLDAFGVTSVMPDLLNVKYLIYRADQYAQEKEGLGAKYQPVFQSADGSRIVLENKTVLPKAWLVPAVVRAGDLQQTLGILKNPEFNPRSLAIVESAPPLPLASAGAELPIAGQNVAVTSFAGERITVEAQAPQNALLVLGEKYYQGWHATVDGAPVEIYPVDQVLRGVYLTPGQHKVEFLFDPQPYKIGKWLSLTAFFFYACVIGWEVIKLIKKRRLSPLHV